MLGIVKNVIYFICVSFCSIHLATIYDWPTLVYGMVYFLCFAFPLLIDSWLNRYQRKGRLKSRKRRYEEAILYFQKSYEYYECHAWAEICRHWLWPFSRKGTGQEEAVIHMLLCCLALGQRQKALECIKELKERWPEGLIKGVDLSFLEDGNFQEFQRENEEQITAALSGLLSKGEKLELCFYGITGRHGRMGRKWKNRPSFVGLSGNDLLVAVLKRPALEETEWAERYLLKVKSVKQKTPFSDWYTFEIVCVNGDKLKIQCLMTLAANQYPGQEENVRRFAQALEFLAIQSNVR